MTLWLLTNNLQGLDPIQRAAVTRYLIISPEQGVSDFSQLTFQMRQVMSRINEDIVVDPILLKDSLESQYSTESQLSRLILMFSAISLVVSLMGLYGVLSYIIDRRRKEFGIRRVVGANVLDIFRLLAGRLIPIIGLASIPVSIVSFYAANKWLSQFAYRIEINPIHFVNAFIVVSGLVMLLIVANAFISTFDSPSQALRTE
tara:strand:+ start:108 stop:713 length:606 start_codon:yes stop_codon:yes gene_type:complete